MYILRLVFAIILGVLKPVAGHSVFTTLFVKDVDQGDGTCVRMPMDPHNATYPINDLNSDDMACGFGGTQGVARVCSIPRNSRLSFLFREYPDNSQPGAIDSSHLGPCSIYMKRVSSSITSPATGDGWFKIASSGYDPTSKKWCTEKLSANNGIMSFPVPDDLVGGYYLVRPELLALQDADKVPPNPQFYAGCAQVFLVSDATRVPSETVRIPGYVSSGDAAVLFDVYNPVWPYKEPGPDVYIPGKSPVREVEPVEKQIEGLLPENAYLTNANWWSVDVSPYGDEAGCWNASKTCYVQAGACYSSAPPTGSKNCRVWEGRCRNIQIACDKGFFTGPPVYTLPLGTLPSNPGFNDTENVATQSERIKPNSATALTMLESTKRSTTSVQRNGSRTRSKQVATTNFAGTESGQIDFGSATAPQNAILASRSRPNSLHQKSSTVSRDLAPDASVYPSVIPTGTLPIRPVTASPTSSPMIESLDFDSTTLSAVVISTSSKTKSVQMSSTTSDPTNDAADTSTSFALLDPGTTKSAVLSSEFRLTSTDTNIIMSNTVGPATPTSTISISEFAESKSLVPSTLTSNLGVSSHTISSSASPTFPSSPNFTAKPVTKTAAEPSSTSSSLTTNTSPATSSTSTATSAPSSSIEIIPSRHKTTSLSSSVSTVSTSLSVSADTILKADHMEANAAATAIRRTRRARRLR